MSSAGRSFGINGLATKYLQSGRNMGLNSELSKSQRRLCAATVYE